MVSEFSINKTTMGKRITLLLSVLLLAVSLNATEISRVEPPSWWVGMNNSTLQIMLYGNDLKGGKVTTGEKGIKILSVKYGDSPNYLFIEAKISPKLKPGRYLFTVTKGNLKADFLYTFDKKGSAGKMTGKGFGPQDMVYLLMPDRFANGDKSNDSHPDALEKASYDKPYGRHGGDIQGIINSLDYLSKLGVTAIWSTPMLFDNEPRASYHGYACSDYYKIDPRFGSNELFRKYVAEAANRDIGIIMDMVPNHSGINHWWYNDLPFNDWIHKFPKYTQSNFAMSSHADIHASLTDNLRCTTGWFDTSMPDMNLKNPYLLKYFVQNAVWWTEWAGLAAIRVDTYPYSDKYAVAEWVSGILKEYPYMNIVGECWFSTPAEVAYWEGSAQNRDGYSSKLPSVMDFPLQEAIGGALLKDGHPGWGEGMFRIYRSLSLDFVYTNPYSLLIFADNHDTNRISETLKGDVSKMKMMLALLATMRGTPQIYYGTEIMLKTKDGKLGHGEERLDMPAESEFNPEQRALADYTSKLFTWRKGSKAIHEGKLKHFWPNDNLYVYFRNFSNEVVMVIINNNTKPLNLNWDIYSEAINSGRAGRDIISGNAVTSGNPFEVAPQSACVISFK